MAVIRWKREISRDGDCKIVLVFVSKINIGEIG